MKFSGVVRVSLLAAVAAAAACSFDPSSPAGGAPLDGAPATDGSGAAGDSGPGADAADPDGAPDAAGSDGGDRFCTGVDRDTVALFRFDAAGDLADAAGGHDGSVQGSPLLAPDGPPGCGLAAQFAVPESFISVGDSPDFDLAEGSIDLWVLVTAAPTVERGLFSRDASGQNQPGHVTAVLDVDNRFVVRLQAPGGEAVVCADEVANVGQWHHLAINFGPPRAELYLDGELGTNQDQVLILGDQFFNCNTEHAEGIAGNDAPWVFGADNSPSQDGQFDQPRSFFTGGVIDEVRVSAVRRDFEADR